MLLTNFTFGLLGPSLWNLEDWIPNQFWIFIILIVFIFGVQAFQKQRIKEQIQNLANSAIDVSPEEFFKIRNQSFGGRGRPHYSSNYNFSGVYILINETKGMVYVGQAKKIFDRVNSHFTGKGNGDVYADYKYGDSFRIKMICIENSGFQSLNELEKNTIATYDAFYRGYNKTRGNK